MNSYMTSSVEMLPRFVEFLSALHPWHDDIYFCVEEGIVPPDGLVTGSSSIQRILTLLLMEKK